MWTPVGSLWCVKCRLMNEAQYIQQMPSRGLLRPPLGA